MIQAKARDSTINLFRHKTYTDHNYGQRSEIYYPPSFLLAARQAQCLQTSFKCIGLDLHIQAVWSTAIE